MDSKNIDILVQFARLWGILEATVYTAEDEEISDTLKAYDSVECYNLLSKWVDEYISSDIEDTCEFFNMKIKKLMEEQA